jgi:hypothetical protein
MKPTIGKIVYYKLPDWDKTSINGNKSDILPAVIVAVWSDTSVSLKVITDGLNDLWKTSVQFGDTTGTWSWPTIE